MKVFIGIELGSTRIKAVAIDQSGKPLASGGFDWENRLENGVWTYHFEEVWGGLQESYKQLSEDFLAAQGAPLTEISGVGISAMMHGYIALCQNGNPLTEFRTWRNTFTGESAKLLTKTFGFNIPQRWTIAHLHRAIVKKEAHVFKIDYLTTLAGYIHYKLTGKKVVGVGEAAGIFPIRGTSKDYDADMADKFHELIGEHKMPWRLEKILPKIMCAGENAGYLTPAGAKLLDPAGNLKPGIPLCPPEGDAGTGMVATNAVTPHTGNISAGTSVFAMLVLEKELSKLYPEIDMVATPTGKPVAMVHCNNCTSDLDAWVNLFGDVLTKMGKTSGKTELYRTLYNAALCGDADCGGLVSVNYLSGEHMTGFHEGRPLFARTPDRGLSVENFMRSLIFSSMATLRIGMDLLAGEDIMIEKFLGHGGLFKTPIVGQRLMAAALNIPVAVMDCAGEGGAWGIALLAAFGACREKGETLEQFLASEIFADSAVSTIRPEPTDVKGFNAYLERYKAALEVEKTAVKTLSNNQTAESVTNISAHQA